MTELVPTYATAVNTWQCDENDHLNVQFYTEFGHDLRALNTPFARQHILEGIRWAADKPAHLL